MSGTASRLDEPLPRVLGGKTAGRLAERLGLRTVGDLLRHYPRRWERRGELTELDRLHEGDDVTVLARVEEVRTRQMRRRNSKITEAVVTDGRGRLRLTFFGGKGPQFGLRRGQYGLFAGTVSTYARERQLAHPHFEIIRGTTGGDLEGDQLDEAAEEYADAFIPIYPASAKFPTWEIARCVRVITDTLGELEDPLPESVRHKHELLPLREAFLAMHRPQTWEETREGQRRFRFEEAFVLQVELARRRAAVRGLPAISRVARPEGVLAAFRERLPFRLTDGQAAVVDELHGDLGREHPMHRLLQGEVGSGKTVVALMAMLTVVDAGGQAALLAPTEVLAQQHRRSICELLGPLAERGLLGGSEQGTTVTLLTGSQGTAARRRALLDAASGEAGIVVGTHALLEEDVSFADLGLVVVDEQHRFGVEQRSALAAKGAQAPPHLLVMTATPIPRTVAMTVFGDLDISTLTEMPHGRAAVQTSVVPAADKPGWLDRAWQRVREEVGRGQQVYVVCPRIGETGGSGETADEPPDQAQRPPLAVSDVAPRLREGPFADLRLEVLHGRLAPEEKDAVMRRFVAGEVDVLVATTVVEVGVDVANASVMVIMDADRFGVSQLHQLRGRVGRGSVPGLCLLVSDAREGTPARQRLDAVAATVDGFELSRLDLEQRREGDVLGSDQSGYRSSLRLVKVFRDEELIHTAREDADAVIGADPGLDREPALRSAVDALSDEESADYLERV